MQYISGIQKVINNMLMAEHEILAALGEAVEKTAVQVSNDAKKQHEPSFGHAVGRYENQTTTLTRSIRPELIKVGPDEVVGMVLTNVEYAYPVEVHYPFLFPALVANRELFKKNVKEAMKDFRKEK